MPNASPRDMQTRAEFQNAQSSADRWQSLVLHSQLLGAFDIRLMSTTRFMRLGSFWCKTSFSCSWASSLASNIRRGTRAGVTPHGVAQPTRPTGPAAVGHTLPPPSPPWVSSAERIERSQWVGAAAAPREVRLTGPGGVGEPWRLLRRALGRRERRGVLESESSLPLFPVPPRILLSSPGRLPALTGPLLDLLPPGPRYRTPHLGTPTAPNSARRPGL